MSEVAKVICPGCQNPFAVYKTGPAMAWLCIEAHDIPVMYAQDGPTDMAGAQSEVFGRAPCRFSKVRIEQVP